MPTLTRVSTFTGDLGEAVKRYDSRFREVPVGRGDVLKYGLFVSGGQPNFIMVSKHKDEKLNAYGYNFIATISSDHDALNLTIANNLASKIGITLREAPLWLAQNSGMIDMTFQMFKRYGGQVMDSLGQQR